MTPVEDTSLYDAYRKQLTTQELSIELTRNLIRILLELIALWLSQIWKIYIHIKQPIAARCNCYIAYQK